MALLGVAWFVLWFFFTDRFSGPLQRPSEPLSARPLSAKSAATETLFERLAPAVTGIDFTAQIDNSDPRRFLYETGFAAGGVAIGDVDGDGRPDVYLVSGPGRNRLYRQVGDFRFEDITSNAGVDGGDAWGGGAAMADINNDGRLDIYVCNYDSPNQLYINRGDGTFREMAFEYGLNITDSSLMAALADYDLDGDLDLFLLTNRYVPPHGRPARPPVKVVDGRPTILPEWEKYYEFKPDGNLDDRAGRRDGLLRNNGDGTFTNVSDEAGIWGSFHGLSATWWDFNEDGRPDIYVGNDFNGPDQLYRNNGDGTFADVAAEVLPHTPWFSMGADIADLNDDGHFDLLVADMSRTTHLRRMTSMTETIRQGMIDRFLPRQYTWNALLLNTGVGPFMQAAHLANLDSTDWTWGVKLADFDNDSRVDAYFTTGFTRDFAHVDQTIRPDKEVGRTLWDLAADLPTLREANIAYRNQGGLRFEQVSRDWGLDEVGIALSAAYADLDRDGDLDLVVSNAEGPVSVYRNNSNAGHRLIIRMDGGRSNRFGLGAKVRIRTPSGEQLRWLSPMTGYLSSNEPLVHFGLGDDAIALELTVEWPSGHRQEFRDVKADQLLTIAEPDGVPRAVARRGRGQTWFHPSPSLLSAAHVERPLNDFEKHPLLPHSFTQLGPGMAWADVDGDDDDDLFLGGAAGTPGTLWINRGNGQFSMLQNQALVDDRECEDMGAVWFDADSDGDVDLYVVGGGVEIDPPANGPPQAQRTHLLRDRLYRNDGRGQLTKAAAEVLPALEDSGGPVAAADFDRDGDLDLFVGGRVVPGHYPQTPKSRLLRDEGARFSDVSAELAPALFESGLVTGAVWSDTDGDGWLDLLVTHEWGPVKLYRNREGRLVDETEAAGLSARLGWWNGITGRDIDNDGDIDYVVTNFGRNSRYKATKEAPVRLYYGSFDGTGKMAQVEAYFENGVLYPFQDKNFAQIANPFIAEEYKTYEAFGGATLEQAYTKEALARAQLFEANTLDSGLLINDGKGTFEFRPLPPLAQISPGFGAVMSDFDADGHVDLCIAQNFYSSRISIGRMDGGLSLLLSGDGRGGFQPIMPERSGLMLSGDAKSLTTVDLNGDGWHDLVFGVNNAPLVALENRGSREGRPFRVRLRGTIGNPAGIGSRIVVRTDDGAAQMAEVCAGGGYMSQSSPELAFGIRDGRRVVSVDVRWPDGKETSLTPAADSKSVIIDQRQ
jgi:hypothetical protein